MIRVVSDGGHPVKPQRRHFVSIADVTRDDVERLLGLAESFERTLEREVKKLPTLRGRLIEERAGESPLGGELDITFHRDDVAARGGRPPERAQPVVRDTRLDFELEGKTVILVDDVLYTGRTIRAAIEALFDYGRPARVQLAVLADRGHRELPIRPDYVGKNLPTNRGERIQVQLLEVDEVDRVLLVPQPEEES